MATDRQIEANRLNARKCTGPRTETGKAESSQNALKHGLDSKSEVMRCENSADYDTLIAEYYQRFNPTVPEERCLVDDLIKSEWLGRRYMAVEGLIWEGRFAERNDLSVSDVFMSRSDVLCRAGRCRNSAQRNFLSALTKLQALQAKRASCSSEPSIPNRDCETAAPQPSPSLGDATEPLNPESVSFPTPAPLTIVRPVPAAPETEADDTEKENIPPIAA